MSLKLSNLVEVSYQWLVLVNCVSPGDVRGSVRGTRERERDKLCPLRPSFVGRWADMMGQLAEVGSPLPMLLVSHWACWVFLLSLT